MDVFFVYPVNEGIYFGVVRPSVDIKWAGVFIVSYGHIFHVIHTRNAIFPLPIDFLTCW